MIGRFVCVDIYIVVVNTIQVPVFYRGGVIISRKDRPRRASSLMHDDPYTLFVALDVDVSRRALVHVLFYTWGVLEICGGYPVRR